MYFEGNGVSKNIKNACEWYKAAAEQGDSDAQYNIATMYLIGQGTMANEKEYVKWMIASAQGGNELAKKFLEKMHKNLNK
jgi:TPR repeat protein